MPSGFQQDQNQLTPSYYRVVITMDGGAATWYAQGDGNGDNEGRISTYSWDNFSGSNLPSTLEKSKALARGNLRFQSIIEAVENLADCQILDIEGNNSFDADSQADNSVITFTIKFDRDEGFFPGYVAIRKADPDQGNGTDGTVTYDNVTYPQYWSVSGQEATIGGTADAIRDIIWKALAQGRTRSVRVFHPLLDSDPRTGEGFQEVITAAKPFSDGDNGNAFNDIAVTEINGTTTTITTD